MYGIYANIGGILMGSMLPYIPYMDPMGYESYDIPKCNFHEKSENYQKFMIKSHGKIHQKMLPSPMASPGARPRLEKGSTSPGGPTRTPGIEGCQRCSGATRLFRCFLEKDHVEKDI